MTGTITKVEWTNPHIWYYLDVKNPDGTVTNWGVLGRRARPADAARHHQRSADRSDRNGHRRRLPRQGRLEQRLRAARHYPDGRNVLTASRAGRPRARSAEEGDHDEDASVHGLLLALAIACACGARSCRRTSTAAAPRRIPRTADGKPDFTGTYQWPTYLPGDERGRSSATVFDRKRFAPLKPGGEAFLEPRTGDPRHDEPRDFCMPAGFPGGMLSGNAMQFFQTKNYLVMVHEFQRMTRIIPLDGRPHRKGLEPMFYGDPVGQWEGDTLVIDTTNFKRWALDDYYYTNPKEYRMHSDALHTIERLTLEEQGRALLRADDRRSEDLHRAVVAGVRDRRQAGVGRGGAVRIRLRGEQPLPRRQVRGRGEVGRARGIDECAARRPVRDHGRFHCFGDDVCCDGGHVVRGARSARAA